PSAAWCLHQVLPATKSAAACTDWHSNPATLTGWGVNSISDRYASPAAAWDFWQANGLYCAGPH
ncbi:hypothetical protein CLM83_00230, partial [Streptomyces albidoflavus]